MHSSQKSRCYIDLGILRFKDSRILKWSGLKDLSVLGQNHVWIIWYLMSLSSESSRPHAISDVTKTTVFRSFHHSLNHLLLWFWNIFCRNHCVRVRTETFLVWPYLLSLIKGMPWRWDQTLRWRGAVLLQMCALLTTHPILTTHPNSFFSLQAGFSQSFNAIFQCKEPKYHKIIFFCISGINMWSLVPTYAA